MMKKSNKGKKTLTAVGAMVVVGLTPGIISATPECLPIQGSNAGYGELRPNEVIQRNDTKVEESVIFKSVEQMPQFLGGEAALMKYLQSHINYPPMAAELGMRGRVIVRFVVNETGKVGEVEVIRSVFKDLDREAVRVCKSLPKFTPGRHNGQAVSVWYTLPVSFSLNGVPNPTAADVVAINGQAYSFDELYAKQHPNSVGSVGLLEILVSGYQNVTKYGVLRKRTRDIPVHDAAKRKVEIVYSSVDQMPQFPGGEEALIKHIESHIQYPPKALLNNVQGCVLVKFVVEETGKISRVKVVLSVDEDLDKEAVRLVKTLPFIPGRKNGKPVSVWDTVQVIFKLPQDNDDKKL